MSFRLVPKLVTLNDLERRNSPYFALLHRIFLQDVVAKRLLGLPRFQNLRLIVYDHIKTICATKSERKMLASACLYSLYAWLIIVSPEIYC